MLQTNGSGNPFNLRSASEIVASDNAWFGTARQLFTANLHCMEMAIAGNVVVSRPMHPLPILARSVGKVRIAFPQQFLSLRAPE